MFDRLKVHETHQSIDDCDQWNGNPNGERQVHTWVDDFLSNIVQVVPAIVSPEPGIKGCRNVPN